MKQPSERALRKFRALRKRYTDEQLTALFEQAEKLPRKPVGRRKGWGRDYSAALVFMARLIVLEGVSERTAARRAEEEEKRQGRDCHHESLRRAFRGQRVKLLAEARERIERERKPPEKATAPTPAGRSLSEMKADLGPWLPLAQMVNEQLREWEAQQRILYQTTVQPMRDLEASLRAREGYLLDASRALKQQMARDAEVISELARTLDWRTRLKR